jgi:hypothetical protein
VISPNTLVCGDTKGTTRCVLSMTSGVNRDEILKTRVKEAQSLLRVWCWSKLVVGPDCCVTNRIMPTRLDRWTS